MYKTRKVEVSQPWGNPPVRKPKFIQGTSPKTSIKQQTPKDSVPRTKTLSKKIAGGTSPLSTTNSTTAVPLQKDPASSDITISKMWDIEHVSASIYPYMCPNCDGLFKSEIAFSCHSSRNRPACAYRDNEVVTNLSTFTPENVYRGLLEKHDQ